MTPIPTRGNAAHDCKPILRRHQDPTLPDHIIECECEAHTGFCVECNFKVTIGPTLVEYGHARARNRDSNNRKQGDCPHRPCEQVDPKREGKRKTARAQLSPIALGILTVALGVAMMVTIALANGVFMT